MDEPNSTQPFDQPSFDEDQLSIQHVAHSLYDNKDSCPREDISTPAICYNDSLIAVHVTPGHLDLVISLSSSLDTDNEQQLFSDDDDPITPQDSEVCSQIPTMNVCPVDLFDETNHSTSLPNDSEYQPLPGSDSGVLWYHEQLRAYLCNAILSSLPETWTKWITSNVSAKWWALVAKYLSSNKDISPFSLHLLTLSFIHYTFIASNTQYHLCNCDVYISSLASFVCSLEASEC